MAGWGLSWLETATQKIREVEHSINAAVGQDDDEPLPPVRHVTASAPTTPAAAKSSSSVGLGGSGGGGPPPSLLTPQPIKPAGWNGTTTRGAPPKKAASRQDEPSLEDLLNSDALLPSTASPTKKKPSAVSVAHRPTAPGVAAAARRSSQQSSTTTSGSRSPSPPRSATPLPETTSSLSPHQKRNAAAVAASTTDVTHTSDVTTAAAHERQEEPAAAADTEEAAASSAVETLPSPTTSHVQTAPPAPAESLDGDAVVAPDGLEEEGASASGGDVGGDTSDSDHESEQPAAAASDETDVSSSTTETFEEEDPVNVGDGTEAPSTAGSEDRPSSTEEEEEGESESVFAAADDDADAAATIATAVDLLPGEAQPDDDHSEVLPSAEAEEQQEEEQAHAASESSSESEEAPAVAPPPPQAATVEETEAMRDQTAANLELENRVSTLSRVLAERERQIESLAREHASLQDACAQTFKEKEEALRWRRDAEGKMGHMRDELTQRIAALERTIGALTKERDSLRQQLRKREDKDMEDSEKDEIMTQLREEGEKLSQKQLKLESTIKQLRTKEKESDVTIASLKEELADAEARVEAAQSKVRDNDSLVAKYNDMVSGLKEAAEVAARNAEDKERAVAAAQQRVSELEADKEKALRQAAEARKLLQAAEERRESELDKARAEAKDTLHDQLRRADERESALALTVQQLRASFANLGEQSAGREDLLRQEIQSLQGRLAAAEARAAEVATTIAEATTPLVRQIDSLHQAHSHTLQEQHRIERALTERIREEEERAEEAHGELQRAHDSMNIMRTKMRELEGENEELSERIRALAKRADDEQRRAAEAREECEQARKAAQTARQELDEAKRDYESRLALELTKAARDHQQALAVASAKEHPQLLVANGAKYSGGSAEQARRAGSGEFALRHKDADIASLQGMLAAAERAKHKLEDELVALTSSNDALSRRVGELEAMEGRMAEVQRRYATALELVGEKTEQVEELRADLADMKELYRSQISELLAKIDALTKQRR